MSDFTIVNFKEIEDSAADREGVEARFARKHLDSEHLGVTFMRYDANVRSPKAHSHRPRPRPRRRRKLLCRGLRSTSTARRCRSNSTVPLTYWSAKSVC